MIEVSQSQRVTSKRQRSLVLLAWFGGWCGGPLVAFILLASERKKVRGWSYRGIQRAAMFWSILVVAYVAGFLVDVRRGSGGLAGWQPSGSFLLFWGVIALLVVAGPLVALLSVRRGGVRTS